MAENGTFKVFTLVGSVIAAMIVVVVTVFNTVYAPLSCALAEERTKRETTDKEILLIIRDSIKEQTIVMAKQGDMINDNRLDLGSIKKDIEYIRKNIQ